MCQVLGQKNNSNRTVQQITQFNILLFSLIFYLDESEIFKFFSFFLTEINSEQKTEISTSQYD